LRASIAGLTGTGYSYSIGSSGWIGSSGTAGYACAKELKKLFSIGSTGSGSTL